MDFTSLETTTSLTNCLTNCLTKFGCLDLTYPTVFHQLPTVFHQLPYLSLPVFHQLPYLSLFSTSCLSTRPSQQSLGRSVRPNSSSLKSFSCSPLPSLAKLQKSSTRYAYPHGLVVPHRGRPIDCEHLPYPVSAKHTLLIAPQFACWFVSSYGYGYGYGYG